MALPKSTETPRLKHLNSVLHSATADDMLRWSGPSKEDYALIGAFVVQYSYLDMNLYRLIEVLDNAGQLPGKSSGKMGEMRIGDVETALQAMPDCSPQTIYAFEQIRECRKTRNLFAHFAARRFPDDDAFLLLTKSALDFKRSFGRDP